MRLLRALEAIQKSLCNPKNILKGIEGILTCPLWLQIYVSIVNSPVEYYSFYYYIDITYDVLLIFPQLFGKLKHDILYKLCRDGALSDLIKIHARFQFVEWRLTPHDDIRSNYNQAFRYACARGHLDVAQWLYTTFQLTVTDVRFNYNQAFRYACARGHLDTAKWLYKNFQLTADDARFYNNYAFKWSQHHGHQDVCGWLVATFGESVKV